MGAGASTMAAPMTEVSIKNKIGVLFHGELSEAFKKAAIKGTNGEFEVSWVDVLAYIETNNKQFLLDPKINLFSNLKAFQKARDDIDEIAQREIKGPVRDIPWRVTDLTDDMRQNGPEGSPAETLDELYVVAELANGIFSDIITEACEGGGKLTIAPLKGRARAEAKARNEYNDKRAPCYSWLVDIVRASVMCMSEDDIVSLFRKLEADGRIIIIRLKNRFNPALFNGYCDLLINIAVSVETASGTTVKHLCELQVHLKAIKDSEPLHLSHTIYEFFRDFFLGNTDAVEQRLEMLCALPITDATNVDDLVNRILSSDEAEDTAMLENLCGLLQSISEFKSVVRIRKHILDFMESDGGHDQVEVAAKLVNLGQAYDDLGDNIKARDYFGRALAIQERVYGRDHVEVADTLVNLGTVYYSLGDGESDYAKARDFLERALAIQERVYDCDHVEVAVTLVNLGNAYCTLGDYTKARDYIERALAIQQREYGRDHVNVAINLMNLGIVYVNLGDGTKALDYIERALAILEREFGREHVEVAAALVHLGSTYDSLGDYTNARDYIERALAIKEREYGRDHVQVAITLGILGNTYESLGDYTKARDSTERALAIEEREYGRDHEVVAFRLELLAVVYRNLGDNTKARAIERRLKKNRGKRWVSRFVGSSAAVVKMGLKVTPYELFKR